MVSTSTPARMRPFDSLSSFSEQPLPRAEVRRREAEVDREGHVELRSEDSGSAARRAAVRSHNEAVAPQWMRRWALQEALKRSSFMIGHMHVDTRNAYVRLARQDPLIARELDLLADQKAKIAQTKLAVQEDGSAVSFEAMQSAVLGDGDDALGRGVDDGSGAERSRGADKPELSLDEDIELGRRKWRDSNTMFDRMHAPANEFSSSARGGRRFSWRPNYDLDQEASKFHFRPTQDRVFRETPEAPDQPPNYVPPPVGDEELQTGEYDEVDAPRLTVDTSKKGRSYLNFPAVSPKVPHLRQIDADGAATGTGSRKTAFASARVMVATPNDGTPRYRVNGRELDEYFTQWLYRDVCLQPLIVVERLDMFDVDVRVEGGGASGQCEAVRMALSNALVHFDPAWRHVLKYAHFLRRDPRYVQPKMAGRKKARKLKTWRKR